MRLIVRLVSLLRLPTLYRLADYVLYPLVYYVVRYRRKIVRRNLQNSFPHYKATELKQLEHKFYHHLCNVMVEIAYGYRITTEEMLSRVRFSDTTQLSQLTLQAGGAVVMLAHIGCWEWLASLQQNVDQQTIAEGNVYRKLKSQAADSLMLYIRNRQGGLCIEKNRLLRTMISRRQDNLTTMYGMLSDQKPSPNNMHFWTTFLNQDTAFLDGSEVLARRFRYPVFYLYITSPRRGYYDVEVKLIAEHPEQTAQYEITAQYARLLEDNILRQPQLWLWTHNRWKWSRKDIPANLRTNL